MIPPCSASRNVRVHEQGPGETYSAGLPEARRVLGQAKDRLSCPLQEEHEHLLQAAVEQAEGLEHSLRNAEAVLAERAAQLRDAQVSARGASAACPCLSGTPAWDAEPEASCPCCRPNSPGTNY